jgi:uncharacterized protein (DUF1697 family)
VGATHVALFRGINVGHAKRVAMADLRALLAELGYLEARTLLNSGNGVFAVRGSARGDPAGRIEKAVAARLGVSSRVTVITARELVTILRDNPLLVGADHPGRLMVTVLARPADRTRLAPLAKQKWTPEALGLGARAAYLWCPHGIIKSPLAKAVERVLGDSGTSRNWNTMIKLGALVGEEP